VIKVPFERWWQTIVESRFEGVEGRFVHPVEDELVIAGNGTIGLELIEDLPDVDTVLVPFGGGGLSTGIASAVKALRPEARVYGVDPETAPALSSAFAAGRPVEVEHRRSFVDGSGSRGVLEPMWPYVREALDGAYTASLEETADAVRLLAERVRVIAEGAGALALAVARSGRVGGGRIACIVSGGNIDVSVLTAILAGETPR
jgi:threonine dehydratase